MAYKLIDSTQGMLNGRGSGRMELLVDAQSDLSQADNDLEPCEGSIAYDATMTNIWMKNPDGTWIKWTD